MAEINGITIDEMTETINASNDDYLIISTSGGTRKVKAKYLKGANNLTENYVDLTAENGNEYRMLINNDGSQTIFPIEAFTGADATAVFDYYNGLIINQIYGGGDASGTPVISHSFVELYNDTGRDINLKGMYLFYKTKGSWQKLALRGIIPYQHSFLIRGAACYDPSFATSDLIRCKIDRYDQEWNIPFSDKGFVAFLAVGNEDPTEDDVIRTKTNTVTGETVNSDRFIDIMAGHGTGADGTTVDHFDSKTARTVMNRDTALRKIDFGFNSSTTRSFDCYASVEPINYETCDVSVYRPRCLSDGKWDYYVNRLKLNQNIPNLVNICFGADGETTRTFTWQSKVTDTGYLKYRRISDASGNEVNESWNKIETTREMVKHHDQDCTIHRAIAKNLLPGIYEYQCGEEGSWSDIETFEVKKYLESSDGVTTYKPMRILWTSDQQGWQSDEYRAWKTAVEAIAYHEGTNFDWHLNTGDVSQNASRSFEWRYYFKHSRELTRNMPHMITCGNNDLIDKKYGKAFKYYLTTENNPKVNEYITDITTSGDPDLVSTYAWDLGYVHFVCVNSNEEQMYDGITVNQFIEKQCAYLDAHLTEVRARETQPRWIIVFMHLSPFTCVRTPRVQPFVPIFEKHKVDAVLCGHNHTYTRSKCLRTGFNGVPYKDMSTNTGITYNRYVDLKEVSDGTVTNLIDANKEYKDYNNTDLGPINREEDLINGTYYIMNGATGFKTTGKETGIVFNINSIIGSEHSNTEIQSGTWPWWYAHWGGKMSQPAYIIIEITGDSIKFIPKQIPNVLTADSNNTKIKVVNDFDYNNPDNFKPNSDYDTNGLTIDYNTRHPE